VALIAGGAGITPIRALFETLPGGPGEVALLYRAQRPEELVFREELDELARRRGAEVHYVVGGDSALSAQALARLLPDVGQRDVFVCGPPAMVEATRTSLREAGVPGRHIFTERFAL
jgi:ferredoxin-NADP reductase